MIREDLFDPNKNLNTGDPAIATKPAPVLGPLSSIFDWNKEEAKIEEDRAQSKQANERIIKTNAIGEVFRALADTAGVARGGTAKAAPINPLAVQAFNDIKQQDVTYREQLERVQTRKLASAQDQLRADLTREELTRREGEATKERDFELQERKKDRDHQASMQASMAEANKMAELESILAKGMMEEDLLNRQYALTKNADYAKQAQAIALQNNDSKNTIAQYKAKALFDRGMFSEADLQEGGVWNLSKPKGGESGRVSFVVPDIKREIGLSTGAVNEIVRSLSNMLMGPDGNVWAASMPPALRDIANAKNAPINSVLIEMGNNWDWIKDPKNGVLPGPVYKAIYGVEPSSTNPAAGQGANSEQQQEAQLYERLDFIIGDEPYNRKHRPQIAKAVSQVYSDLPWEAQNQIVENIIQQYVDLAKKAKK